MRIAAALLLTAASLGAQIFDPTMPPTVPAVSGKVVEFFGLRYIDVKVGDGAPSEPGQEYTVQYTGWLRDGSKFDSSVGKATPFTFVQGRRGVIAGWEAGFEGMKVVKSLDAEGEEWKGRVGLELSVWIGVARK